MSNIKTPFLFILLFLTFMTSCNRQTPINQKEQYPTIVRTLGVQAENVSCELLDKEGNLWFSIKGEGVYRYNNKSFTNITTKDGLCNNNVGPIIQDRAGNILFGTSSGICKYDGKKFTSLPMTDTLNIISLIEDRDGNLWFGALNKGIYRYDGKQLSHFLYKYEHPFYGEKYEKYIGDIMQDTKGNIWFSSWNGGGVWRYDGKDLKNFLPSIDYYKTDQDNRRPTNTPSPENFTPSNKPFVQSEDYISDDMIFSIAEDNLGNIWFATRRHGACRFDGKTFKTFGPKEGFLSDGAYAILKDKKGNLWFTTEKEGIWCYDGKTFKNYDEKDGLLVNAVTTAIEDKEGNLWFGMKNFGLSRFDGKTFRTFSQ
jgi:ligand-binding sensor domain-containing protein